MKNVTTCEKAIEAAIAKTKAEVRDEIQKLSAIHGELSEQWTGLRVDGKRETMNPHREKIEILLDLWNRFSF